MTPSEKNIVRALVAVAWADGTVEKPEEGIIEGLLWAFGASDEDEQEILAFAGQKRTIKNDADVSGLAKEDKELLLAHAALLTHADGNQTKNEQKVLKELVNALGFADAEAKPIIAGARDRAKKPAGQA